MLGNYIKKQDYYKGGKSMSLQINASQNTLTIDADNIVDNKKIEILTNLAELLDKNLKIKQATDEVIISKDSLEFCLKKLFNITVYPKLHDKVKKNIVNALDELDDIRNPDYYNRHGLSPIEAFQMGLLSHEEYIGFLKGNIIKYSVRCDNKNMAEDMEKCKTYAEYLKEVLTDEK